MSLHFSIVACGAGSLRCHSPPSLAEGHCSDYSGRLSSVGSTAATSIGFTVSAVSEKTTQINSSVSAIVAAGSFPRRI